MCEALPRVLSFIINKWNLVQYFVIANAIFYYHKTYLHLHV